MADSIESLVIKMNQLTGEKLLNIEHIRRQVESRDRELDNKFMKDLQITVMHGARNYLGDKFIRTAKPHKFLDYKNRPLIAVKLHILNRKILGGLQTNLSSQVLNEHGSAIVGLYAVGEVAGLGGGAIHGYRSLERTFLGNCLFTGKVAGEAIIIALR